MAGLRDSGEEILLSWLLNGVLNPFAVYGEQQRFIHLFTVDPANETNVISSPPGPSAVMPGEVPMTSDREYRPQPVAGGQTTTPPWRKTGVSPTTYTNNTAYSFANLPASTIVAWGFSRYDGVYNLLLTGLFAAPITVVAGGTLVIPRNSLTVTLD